MRLGLPKCHLTTNMSASAPSPAPEGTWRDPAHRCPQEATAAAGVPLHGLRPPATPRSSHVRGMWAPKSLPHLWPQRWGSAPPWTRGAASKTNPSLLVTDLSWPSYTDGELRLPLLLGCTMGGGDILRCCKVSHLVY